MTPQPGAISARIERLVRAEQNRDGDPELIARMPSGWAVLGRFQPPAVRGCCMLLPERVVPSPNELTTRERERFFADLVLLGDAILEVTGAERINYLVLCNQVPELHGHCVPRFASEDPAKRLLGPFEAYDFGGSPLADGAAADRELVAALRASLRQLLEARGA